VIGEQELRRVVEVVERAYPDEGCGWIAGTQVREVMGGRRDGFAFGDRELIEMARVTGEVVVFHSHPDGEERLSGADLEQLVGMQLVVAVAGGRARAAALWRIQSDGVRLVQRWSLG
jgi:proteasome lid subunit RPN8/RPN11